MPDNCPQESRWKQIFEWCVQGLILYSIVTYYLEVESTGHLGGGGGWMYNERIIGCLFTAEYIFRWCLSRDVWYPFRAMAIVDMLATLPFYLNFFVDLRSLRLVRTLRVLRLLKLYRYSHALQHVLRGFLRVKDELLVVGFVVAGMILFSSVTMFEFEHEAQPDKFGRLSDAIWWSFVTLTTVGYGDLYPITLGGRLIGVLTMVVGIGVFGIFISLIGSSFLATMKKEEQHSAHQASLEHAPAKEPHSNSAEQRSVAA